MDVFKIEGGVPLSGCVKVSGAKNASLPMLTAALMTDQTVVLRRVPDLSDVSFMLQILEAMGTDVQWDKKAGVVTLNTPKLATTKAPYEFVRKMRASIWLMGAILGREGQATVSMPGGCAFGVRPIDLHLKGFRKLGCKVSLDGGYVSLDGSQRKGADIFLGGRFGPSVGATQNVLMTAVLTPGTTRIQAAACEPEVDSLALMLNAMGAKISGIGSHTLVVEGVEKLHGCDIEVIPDRIEAGSFLMAAAITKGRVTVEDLDPSHLGSLLDKFDEIGVRYELKSPTSIFVDGTSPRKAVDMVTMPYPAYPTDLQAQLLALMVLTPGLSVITERIYPSRFMHVPELMRMGADVAMEGASAIVKGVEGLSGAPIMASDLRAGIALVMAGLAAKGTTWVQRIYHLDRGYENLAGKLRGLGGRIERMSADDMPKEDEQCASSELVGKA